MNFEFRMKNFEFRMARAPEVFFILHSKFEIRNSWKFSSRPGELKELINKAGGESGGEKTGTE